MFSLLTLPCHPVINKILKTVFQVKRVQNKKKGKVPHTRRNRRRHGNLKKNDPRDTIEKIFLIWVSKKRRKLLLFGTCRNVWIFWLSWISALSEFWNLYRSVAFNNVFHYKSWRIVISSEVVSLVCYLFIEPLILRHSRVMWNEMRYKTQVLDFNQ